MAASSDGTSTAPPDTPKEAGPRGGGDGWRGWIARRGRPVTLNLMRIVTGFLFFQHGLPKIFGILGRSEPAAFLSRQWFSGILEVVGGSLVAVGLHVQPVSFVLAGEMAFAYFLAHAPRGFWPTVNGGELAALYCFVFLYFAMRGGGRFSVDGWRNRRRGG